MRSNSKRVNQFRLRDGGQFSTDDDSGNQGVFWIPFQRVVLKVMASHGGDWQESGLNGTAFEHVSVSLPARCPTWEEMSFIKDLFWELGETVIQYHPPKSQHVNFMTTCLHLWRPIGVEIPLPPSICVGPQAGVHA